MINSHGIDIPKKCQTCHYKEEISKSGSKIKCKLHLCYSHKFDLCKDYIMHNVFDNIGKSINLANKENFESFRKSYLENKPEASEQEIRNYYICNNFIF